MLKFPIIFATAFSIFCTAHASTFSAGTIYISTASEQIASSGITLSSYVYIAPNSRLTLDGDTGVITSISSISAGAFFGDGSHLTGIGILDATQTFSGANSFTSSFAVYSGGNRITLSTSSSSNNITIDASGVATFFPTLHNSSYTSIPEASTTNTSFGPCVAGSTLTISTNGGRVEIVFSGSLSNSTANPGFPDISQIDFLIDGHFANGLASTQGFKIADAQDDVFSLPISIDYLSDILSAGTHSFCVTLAAGSSSTATLINSASSNIFYLKEIK